jgi:hypothetical protein
MISGVSPRMTIARALTAAARCFGTLMRLLMGSYAMRDSLA